jgi:molecular chaperone GrpE
MSDKETIAANSNIEQSAEQDPQPSLPVETSEAAAQETETVPGDSVDEPSEPPGRVSCAAEDGNVEPTEGVSHKVVDNIGPETAEGEVLEAEVSEEPDPLAVAQEENKRLREKVLRLAADFDNFRKRARRDNEESARRARVDLLREMLPVFDNMERAVAHSEQAPDVQAVATGVKMVVKQFQDVVAKLGVERIQAVGEPFDPNVHEAIQQVETSDYASGTVVAEMLAGYRWGERLLRAAMVVVARGPASPVADVPADDEAEAHGGADAERSETDEHLAEPSGVKETEG